MEGVGVYYQKGVVWRLKCDLHPLLRLLRSLIFMSRQNIGLKIKVKVFIWLSRVRGGSVGDFILTLTVWIGLLGLKNRIFKCPPLRENLWIFWGKVLNFGFFRGRPPTFGMKKPILGVFNQKRPPHSENPKITPGDGDKYEEFMLCVFFSRAELFF